MILDQEKFESIMVTEFIDVVCDYCGKTSNRSKRSILGGRKIIEKDACKDKNCSKQKREESCLKKYGVKNAGGTECSLNKIKKTCFEKYGTENPNSIDVIKEKIKNTNIKKYGKSSFLATNKCKELTKNICLERYGVEFFGQSEECKEKAKETSLEKYGEVHFSKTKYFLEKAKLTSLEKYGVDNVMKSDKFKNKFQSVFLFKYGVKSPLQNKVFLEKVKATYLEKYGVDNYAKTPEFKSKYKNSCLEKYGVSNPLKSEIFKNKSKLTSLEKYGVNHYSKTNECKQRYRNFCLINYNKNNYFQTDEFKEKSKNTCILKYNKDSYSKTYAFKERYKETCLKKYGVSTTLLLMKSRIYGKSENELKDFLNSFGFNFKKNYTILDGKELDLYDENKKIAFEYCGLYWHSEASPSYKDKNYHYNKYKTCKDKGIHLITIFEDEWKLRKNQCKNFIKSIIQINDNKIFARNCQIKQIDNKTCYNFCDLYHIQGASKKSIVCFGIFNNNDLLGIISLSKHHRNINSNLIVLDRLCFKENVQVVGGASKLFKHCINWAKLNNYEKIISWSDNRWSTGNVYKTLNFQFESELKPDYSYINIRNSQKRISKQSQKKSLTNCPKDKTEHQWALERGFYKIWDCGKIRWTYVIP